MPFSRKQQCHNINLSVILRHRVQTARNCIFHAFLSSRRGYSKQLLMTGSLLMAVLKGNLGLFIMLSKLDIRT